MKIDYIGKYNQNTFSWIYIHKVLLVRVCSWADILQRTLMNKLLYCTNTERNSYKIVCHVRKKWVVCSINVCSGLVGLQCCPSLFPCSLSPFCSVNNCRWAIKVCISYCWIIYFNWNSSILSDLTMKSVTALEVDFLRKVSWIWKRKCSKSHLVPHLLHEISYNMGLITS